MPKTVHSATGYSKEVNSTASVVYFASFSGGGSAQLQVKLFGDWIPADDAVTATMGAADATEASRVPLAYRWSVTVSSGTITTYLL